jgi:hypothetical protein
LRAQACRAGRQRRSAGVEAARSPGGTYVASSRPQAVEGGLETNATTSDLTKH